MCQSCKKNPHMIPFCARLIKVRWDEKLSVYCATENPDQILASSTKGNRAEQGIPVQLCLSSSFFFFFFLTLSPFVPFILSLLLSGSRDLCCQ